MRKIVLFFMIFSIILTGCIDKKSEKLNKALVQAVLDNNPEEVSALIKSNASLSAKSDDGMTILMLASQKGYFEIVKLLVTHGADVNENPLFSGDETALKKALLYNNIEIAQYLKDHGADVDAADKSGNTILMLEVKYAARAEIIKWLIENGADASRRNDEGLSALDFATERNDFSITKLLLDKGTEISNDNLSELNAKLWEALKDNNLETAKLILKKITDINAVNNDGKSILMCSIDLDNPGATDLLLRNKASIETENVNGNTCLSYAVFKNKDDVIINKLLKYGADVNTKNYDGLTPLMLAALNKNHDLAKLMLEYGADVNAVDAIGRTALMLCSIDPKTEFHDTHRPSNQFSETARLLLNSGAKINIKDRTKSDALSYALRYHRTGCVLELIKRGADVSSMVPDKYRNKYPAIVWASRKHFSNADYTPVIKLLVEKKADVNARSTNGTTALIEQTKRNNTDMIEFLLANNADVTITDDEGVTALDIAKRNRFTKAAEILQQAWDKKLKEEEEKSLQQ